MAKDKAPTDIEVKNPGILGVPDGKNFWDLPVSHFIDLAKSKGKGAIMKALLNLERWNKNDDPDISKKARAIIDKLTGNTEWEKIPAKSESVEAPESFRIPGTDIIVKEGTIIRKINF